VSDPGTRIGAAEAWRAALAAWALPGALLAAAPEDPYALPVGLLTTPLVEPLATPTGRVARQRLAGTGSLLDVGCGAGRFTAAFLGVAHRVRGVEPQPHLAAAAREQGIEVVEGRWPDVAGDVERADVVVSTHVLYDVEDAGPFVSALHDHARRAVVLELTATHPWVDLGPLYRAFHGLDRPSGPTAGEAAAVVAEVTGATPELEWWQRPGNRFPDLASYVAARRRQLCLPPEHDPDLAAALEGTYHRERDGSITTPTVDVATLWWTP
jgi:SAM-dependent methyltransferase